MCILLTTSEHPDYPFILLSNRDEYFKRPTQPATLRKVNDTTSILSPLDMAREEHGTWIGVSTTGKVAVLVNYRETDSLHILSEVSRGILPLDYIKSDVDADDWYSTLKDKNIDLSHIGGFSFIYGQLSINPETQKVNHLNVLSNRGDQGTIFEAKGDTTRVGSQLHGEIGLKTTVGLSNSLYYDPWVKVNLGENLLNELVIKSVKENYTQDQVVEAGFEVLSHDTFDKEVAKQQGFEGKLVELKNSIFIPPLETHLSPEDSSPVAGNYYGTRTQTILLLDRDGYLNYYERDIHSSDTAEPNPNIQTSHFRFKITQ